MEAIAVAEITITADIGEPLAALLEGGIIPAFGHQQDTLAW